MDSNLKLANEQRIKNTIKALEKNRMNGYLVNDKNELISKIEELVAENSVVSCGGSVTLFETSVIDHLRSGRYTFLDRYKENLTKDDITDIFKKTFLADAYFASANAVTEDGELFYIDGNGNRVAAILYGPEKVILVCGANKIVKDESEALNRVKCITAPANARRLKKQTPCGKLGYCMDCKGNDRMCNSYTTIKGQHDKDRIHVIFLNDNFGY